MAIDLTVWAADLDFMQDDIPDTITWNDATYSVASGDNSKGLNIDIDGMAVPFDCTFYCKVSDFASMPTTGQAIGYRGRQRTIVKVETDAANVGFILYCESAIK